MKTRGLGGSAGGLGAGVSLIRLLVGGGTLIRQPALIETQKKPRPGAGAKSGVDLWAPDR